MYKEKTPAEAGSLNNLPSSILAHSEKLMQYSQIYISMGWHIIPMNSVRPDGYCTCSKGKDCSSPGKHPRIKDWVDKASAKPEIINEWLSKWTDTNIAVATGRRSGIIVLDIDIKYNGDAELQKLERQLGKLPDTLTVLTGGGGFHYYFKYPNGIEISNQNSKIASGIDIKSDGGSATIPPSRHKSGNEYRWKKSYSPIDIGLTELPPEWISFIQANSSTIEKKGSIELPEIIPEGQRNETLYKLACSLRSKGLCEDEILATVSEVNKNRCSSSLEDEEIKTIVKSSIRHDAGKLCDSVIPFKVPKGISARELLEMDMPEVSWVIDNLISTGLHILAGKPKIGKSFLALMLALKVVSGNTLWDSYNTSNGKVLYLALEDSYRRLKKRLNDILLVDSPPEKLQFSTEWNDIENGGIETLEAWITDNPDTKLVIIDTLQRFRGRQKANTNMYSEDYMVISKLKKIADKFEIAIIVVHHLRKMSSNDVFDMVSGSLGLTGGADSTFVLAKEQRGRAEAVLHVVGRDIEEKELALKFEKLTCTWVLLGDAEEQKKSKERQEIIELLRHSEETMSPKEIAECLNKTTGSIRFLLSQMLKSGEVVLESRGKYTCFKSNDSNTTNNTNNPNYTNVPNTSNNWDTTLTCSPKSIPYQKLVWMI